MNEELQSLIERSRGVELSAGQLEEGRIAISAANGAITDSRITVDTMRAVRTIMLATEQPVKADLV